MIIECGSCPVRGTQCGDCVVTALLTPSGGQMPLDGQERAVVARLVGAGLLAVDEAAQAQARREPWSQYRAAVG